MTYMTAFSSISSTCVFCCYYSVPFSYSSLVREMSSWAHDFLRHHTKECSLLFTQNLFIMPQFLNSFKSNYRPCSYTWEINGLPFFIRDRYSTKESFLDAICTTENEVFYKTNCSKVRKNLLDNPEFRKLSSKGRFAPFILSNILAYNVFSDTYLRSEFCKQYPPGVRIPLGVVRIYNNLRETKKANISISFRKQNKECQMFDDTILSNSYLKLNEQAMIDAFELMVCERISEHYEINFSTITVEKHNTHLSNCNSMVVSFAGLNSYTIDVAPWSNTQKGNEYFDPLVDHLYIALYGGSRLYNENGEIMDYSNYNNEYHEIGLTTSSYWNQYIYFFFDKPLPKQVEAGPKRTIKGNRRHNPRLERKGDEYVMQVMNITTFASYLLNTVEPDHPLIYRFVKLLSSFGSRNEFSIQL